MKKLIMMMALAVGLTGFAAQNDKLISFYTNGPDTYADGSTVVDGECYALVWVKTGATFNGFNADGSAADSDNNAVLQISACAKDGKCNGVLFHVAAERDATYANTGAYQVFLMDTRDAVGVPSAVADNSVARVNGWGLCASASPVRVTVRSATSLLAADPQAEETSALSINSYVCLYGDAMTVLQGERCVLVRSREGAGGFKGFTFDCRLVDSVNNEVVKVFTAANTGVFADVEIGKTEAGWDYELIVLDTRMPDGSLSPLADGRPKLVSGWGEFVMGADGQTILSVWWHPVKIGSDAAFYSSGKMFDYDPSKNLEKGFAAVYVEEAGAWQVHELPKAYDEIVDNGVIGSQEGYAMLCDPTTVNPTVQLDDPFVLDVTYKFLAFTNDIKKVVDAISPLMPKDEWGCADFKNLDAVNAAATQAVEKGDITAEEAAAAGEFLMRVKPFWTWNCDFEVSFDRPVEKGTYVLAGRYEQAKNFGFNGWVCSAYERDLAPGETVRLLKDNNYKGVYVTYYEICSRVQEFLCGVKNLSPANYGTTITVKLNIYDNTGRCNEKGSKITVGTYKYTFKGPLNARFYNADGTPSAAVANISTNHDGRVGFPMPAMSSGKDDEAFVGWTNANGVVVAATPVLVHKVSDKNPIKSWYAAEEPLELYASFKPAKKLEIQTNAGKEGETASNSVIKVTQEWIEKNIGKTEDVTEIKTNLEKKVENEKSDLTYWQAYLLGIDPKDPNADLKVEKTNGKEDDKALVVSTVQVSAPDAGIKVGYSLDKVEADEKEVAKAGDEQTTKDLKIDLAPEGETPTGYYKMNVIFTPTTTTEGGETTEGEKIKVPADNTIGVLRVESEDKIIPVAVPWTSLEKAGPVTVAEVVKTSSLTKNDMMHVYDQENKRYDNWSLDENGEWVAVQSYKLDDKGKVDYSQKLGKPETKSIPRGAGVWLERQDTEKPFYLIGEYKNDGEAKSTVNPPASESSRPEYNLIAPTGIEDTNLNAVKDLVEVNEEDVKDDKLMVLNKGIPNYYTFKNGKWGYSKQVFVTLPNGAVVTKTIRCEDDAVVPAGTGLWYISGKSGETKTIDWSQKVEAK